MLGALVAGLFGMIPFATLLLMFSFFVLVVTKKLDSRGFKVFGYVVTALLWVSIVITVMGGSIKAMARRYPAMQGRSRAQFPKQMMVPQTAQQQVQDQITPSAQAQQPNAAASQNK